MTDVLERLRSVAPDVLTDEPVAFAYLFGTYAEGTTGPRSDVDIAVHVVPGTAHDLLRLRLDLAGEFERRLGVGPVEVIVLDEVPLSLRGRVFEHGAVIFSQDEALRGRYASLTLRRYHDFKIHESEVAQGTLARLAEGR